MAENRYCWRCDMVVPMLTEQEWQLIEPALSQAISDVKAYRAAHGVALSDALQHSYGQTALELYHQFTGFSETNPDAIWHHRLSIYGPPCSACGKPLRTPQASFCAACGTQRA